jgi:hypothetical protein
MAHSCPNCGQACYCGGDIDDIVFEESEFTAGCTCCPDEDDGWLDADDTSDDELDW